MLGTRTRGSRMVGAELWRHPEKGHSCCCYKIVLTKLLPIIIQCDQIWRNSTTLGNILKCLAIDLRIIWFWAKFSTHFGTMGMLLAKFSLLKMAKYWKHNLVIWSHWSWFEKEFHHFVPIFITINSINATKVVRKICTVIFQPSVADEKTI